MWWPRPRWKSDFFTHFILLLFVITVSTTNSVMADEGQHCGGSNMSAVVWTTVFCTMLLILLVIAIYFVYCKRREQSWSSLWWKNNTDKNLILQTLPPSKCGGTDNPAFITDTNIGDHVTKTAITRVIRLPTSTINDVSLETKLSTKEESKRRIYLYKHNDGSEDRLVALRLVFDKEQMQPQQQNCSPASDLSLAIVELSRKYGLHVELETEGENNVIVTSAAMSKNSGENMTKCVKTNNMLSAVCGKAQRLWHQRPFFKHEENCGRAIVNKENNDDVENDSTETITVANKGVISSDQKTLSSCSVTTIDETTTKVAKDTIRHSGGSLRYRTLEYGASPADAMAHSSSDSNIQSCTVNVSDPLAESVVMPMDNIDVAAALEAPEIIDDQINRSRLKSDEPKNLSANPPPPPPRKYSASVIPTGSAAAVITASHSTTSASTIPSSVANTSASKIHYTTENTSTSTMPSSTTSVSSITNTTTENIIATITTEIPSYTVLDNTPLPVDCMTLDKDPRTLHQAGKEIRMDDDYYWCTTTAMATPPMSTFGKQRSSVTVVDSTTEKPVSDEIATVAIDVQEPEDGGTNNLVDSGRDVMAAAGGTTSIEDASLPPFSSDEEDDDMDRGDFATKKTTKFECSTVTTTDMNGVCNGNESNNADHHDGRDAKVEPRCNDDLIAVPLPESKSTTKLPTLRLSLSSPPMTTTGVTSCSTSSLSSASSTSSSTSSSSSSPINNGGNNNSPIVSKIPVRRQSAGSNGGGTTFSTPIITNGTTKKAIPLPLSRSGSRLAMWSSAN